MFKVIEAFTKGKLGHGAGDDLIVQTPHFIAAVDGVTGPEGAAAAACVQRVIEGLKADASERDFATTLAAAMTKEFGAPQNNVRMAGATASILSQKRKEVWVYGDAGVIFLKTGAHYVHTSGESWEEPIYQARAALNNLMILSGEITADDLYTQDAGRAMLDPIRNRQHNLANIEGGYSVLCAKLVPEAMAQVVPVEPGIESLVLVTDGYPLHLMERDDFLSLANIEAKLATINKEDPHCMGINLGPKGILHGQESYDDRTYIRMAA